MIVYQAFLYFRDFFFDLCFFFNLFPVYLSSHDVDTWAPCLIRTSFLCGCCQYRLVHASTIWWCRNFVPQNFVLETTHSFACIQAKRNTAYLQKSVNILFRLPVFWANSTPTITQIMSKENLSGIPGEPSKRSKPGRFSWVKRLMQPRTTTPSKEISRRENRPPRRSTAESNEPRTNSSNAEPLTANNETGGKPEQEVEELELPLGSPSVNFELDSGRRNSKSPSLAETSMVTRPDNISTLPVISMSTMSARSSTFSDQSSHQSTSNTVVSDHPTLYTNASTTGIPPASIMDRRDRVHRAQSMNSHLYNTNNSSNHTFNTTVSRPHSSANTNADGHDGSSALS